MAVIKTDRPVKAILILNKSSELIGFAGVDQLPLDGTFRLSGSARRIIVPLVHLALPLSNPSG
jgi:hypothetical protein